VDPWENADRDDMTVIIGTLFEMNAKLTEIGSDVRTIRELLEDDEDGAGDSEELP
jgi:hypothetical protein